jgi:Adenylate and Guanylate cyclase catalytic domain
MRLPGAGKEYAERTASYLRASASPGAAAAITRMNREIDVRHVLPATRLPTLIVHRIGDRVIDIQHARYLAHHIPGAKLIELPGEIHTPWVGNRDELLNAVEQFLTGKTRTHEPDRLLATVMFTDIVGSTERAAVLGDNRWRELLEVFYARVREVLQLYRGREVSTAGDGFLAAFDGPARAIRCAGAIREAVRALGLDVRCGVHTGECELVGKDLAAPFTLALASRHSPVRARYWSRRQFAIWWQVQGFPLTSAENINSKGCPTSGACLRPFSTDPDAGPHLSSLRAPPMSPAPVAS